MGTMRSLFHTPRRDALSGGIQPALQRQAGVLAEAHGAHRRLRRDAARKTMRFQGAAEFQPLTQETGSLSYDAHQPALRSRSSSASAARPVAAEAAGRAGRIARHGRPIRERRAGSSDRARVPAAGWARRSTRMARTIRGRSTSGGFSARWGWLWCSGAGVMLKAGQSNPAVAVDGVGPSLASAEGSAAVATQPGSMPRARLSRLLWLRCGAGRAIARG